MSRPNYPSTCDNHVAENCLLRVFRSHVHRLNVLGNSQPLVTECGIAHDPFTTSSHSLLSSHISSKFNRFVLIPSQSLVLIDNGEWSDPIVAS